MQDIIILLFCFKIRYIFVEEDNMEMIKLEYFQLVKNFNFLKGNGKLSLI